MINKGEILYCNDCIGEIGPVKPKIVFFDESLPKSFEDFMGQLEKLQPDLVIVMSNALAVSPINSIVTLVGKDIPKVLINMTDTKEQGYPFNQLEDFPERLFYEGKCDEIVQEIVEACGWKDDLKKRLSSGTICEICYEEIQ